MVTFIVLIAFIHTHQKENLKKKENKKELKKMQKVRDHCHYTGKYRGAAHSNCNLKYSIS